MAQDRRTLSEAEFTAIKDRVLDSLPPNLTEPEFQRLIGPAMEQALGEAEYTPATPEGSAAGRFVGNAASMLNPVAAAKGIYQAVRHPIQTIGDIGSAQMGQARQAVEGFSKGTLMGLSEGVGHGWAALLPLVGPAAAGAGEQIGQGDIAGGLGTGAGLLVPSAAPAAFRAGSRVVKGAVSPARREAVAANLEGRAAQQVSDVMSPMVGPQKQRHGVKADKISGDIAKELPGMGTSFSREGFHAQIGDRLTQAEQALDAAADARLAARTFETQPVIDELLAKRKALTVEPIEASRIIPSVTEGVARGIPGNLERNYALRWMADEMRSFPFNKHTFVEQVGKGSTMEVLPGSAGAKIYREIVGPEGHEFIKSGRGDVIKAIEDLLEGKALPDSKLRKAISDVADDLAKGGPAQKSMHTSGPNFDPSDMDTRWRDLSLKKDAPPLVKEGRPSGEGFVPGPNAEKVAVLDKAIAELKRLGPYVRYDTLKTFRQSYDKPAKIKYNPSLTQDFLKVQDAADAAADITGATRRYLAKMDPATAAANADYSLMRSADDLLKVVAETERTRPKVGRRIMARITAALVGGQAAGTAGAVAGIIAGPAIEATSLTTKLARAKLYQKLAEAIRRGDEGHVASLMPELKKMALVDKAAVRKLTGQGGITISGLSTTPAGTPATQP